MGDNDNGGLASSHPVFQTHPVLAGPTTADEFNTIKAALIPVGCWRLEDLRFEFDSSIIRPEARKEFGKLAELVKEHPGAPMTLFGHADPVGDDAYNKQLSGRRARAVFAVLIRKPEIWEQLYTSPIQGSGDAWKYRAIQVMLEGLGHDPGEITGTLTAQTIAATKDFQSKNDLKDDGDPGPLTRAKLFPKYMDFLGVDSEGKDFRLTPGDFLGKGANPDGKADLQGCSEFNPVLMFSAAEKAAFDAPSKKKDRDKENAPNRRVLALLFRPGTKVNLSKWPCPTVKEGTSACEKRFWSDAAKRRKFGDKRRTFEDDRDTFACRFYHRLMVSSPCEGVKPVPIPVPKEQVGPLIEQVPTDDPTAEPEFLSDSSDVQSFAGPAKGVAEKQKVTPQIGPNSLVAVVKRVYTNPNRAIIRLKTDVAFDGQGFFTRSKQIVDFFRKGSANPIKFDNTSNKFSGAELTKGVELEAVGLTPSTSVDDIELTLTLTGGTKKIKPPAKAKMTSVRVTLDICEPRTSNTSDPPVLATPTATPAAGSTSTDKVFGGRPVPLQFKTNYDERAVLIVRQVEPKDFKKNLVLIPEDDKVKLFAIEKPGTTNPENPLPNPHVIDPSKIPAAGLKFFGEGSKESVSARDTGFRLGIAGVTGSGDRVAMTVCHTEIVSNREAKDLKLVAQVPEKPARTTKSPKFMVAPLIVGLEYDIELRHHIELATASAFQWTTPSTKINLTDTSNEVVKLKAKTLSGSLNDVEMDVLLTTNIGKLKKKHKLTCVRVEINPVISGDNLVHTDDINKIRNPAGCVILTGADAGDATKVPKYEITKIEPNLTWTDDDERIAWWIIGGDTKGNDKYDGKADFRNDEASKRGTKIQVFGTQLGDVLIQPYSGGFGYGMFRAHVIPIRQVKYRLVRIFTTAQTAIPLQPALTPRPPQAAQPPFPGTASVPAQPAVPDLPAVLARPQVAAVPQRDAHAPTQSHAEALLHIKLVNLYLRPAGIEMIPDDSAEVARPARAGRPALPQVVAQPQINFQTATPGIPATATSAAVDPQPQVPARAAVPDLPAMPEIKASTINTRIGDAALDQRIIEVTRVSPGHFDVEVNDINLTFNANAANNRAAIRINGRNEVMTFAYIESEPGTALATAHLIPTNHAPQARANPPRAYTAASFTLPDKGTPSSSLIPKTGIPADVPSDEVKMIVIRNINVTWQGASPPTRDINLLWGIIVPTTNIDTSSSVVPGNADSLRLAYGNTLAHEVGHVMGLGHRGVAGDPFFDGLTIPATNIMHPTAPPPAAQNLDIIQVKALRFSEVVFRNP